MTKDNKPSKRRRPPRQAKPHPDFPLTWHPSGQWCKRIAGKTYYFGGDAEKALERYLRERDWLAAGKTPPPVVEQAGLTLRGLVNHFLNSKRAAVDAGELTYRSFVDYRRTAFFLAKFFGGNRRVDDLRPADFADLRRAYSKQGWNPTTIASQIARTRSIFHFGHAAGLLAAPVVFGPEYRKPPERLLRQVRNERPSLFTVKELRAILDDLADVEGLRPDIKASRLCLRAAALLGINAAFGPTDIIRIEWRHVDLDRGVVEYPRGKTGLRRRAILWPETMEALEVVRSLRPTDTDHPNVFLAVKTWAPMAKKPTASPVTREFRKAMIRLGIYGGRRGFYALRHTFRTIADGSLDGPAIDLVMGHATPGMASHYLHGVDDERLRRVAEHVRSWLFGGDGGTGRKPEAAPSTPTKPRLKVVG